MSIHRCSIYSLEILDFSSIMILVVLLNQFKVRNIKSDRAQYLLKAALILFCLRFFGTVVFRVCDLLIFRRNTSKTFTIRDVLELPFCKKIIELFWKEIFFDEKCLIGKIKKKETHAKLLSSFNCYLLFFLS